MVRARIITALLLCAVPALQLFGADFSTLKLSQRVTDLTGTLSPEEVITLESTLTEFEQATSTQLVVVLIPTTEGLPVEQVALAIAEGNGIGGKEKDNGVLLLIATGDRLVRIEVGYGLEGALTDVLSGQIIRREIIPHFREGRHYEGIRAGIDAIILATKNEYQAGPEPDEFLSMLPFIIIFITTLLIFFAQARAHRRGGFFGGPGWVYHTGGRGGSSWSGGGSGGGFSGGGGSFGGGGASGRW